MPLELYYAAASPACRAVLLAARALRLELQLRPLDLQRGDHRAPHYLQLNPQHTVPTLVDGELVLCESRAIVLYLARQYGGAEAAALYPEDLQTRALIDQRLHFDIGTLYPKFAEYAYPQWFGGAEASAEALAELQEALGVLEVFLTQRACAAGAAPSLADLVLLATVSTLAAAGVPLEPYPRLRSWFEGLKNTVPGYKEINEDPLNEFIQNINKKNNK